MIKILSFNIRYGTADDHGHVWENRKSLVINRIRTFDPDLLGLQECRDDDQAEYIKHHLQDYEFYGVHRGGSGEAAIEMAPILFKRNKFKLNQKGCFWLSDTPEIAGSKSKESALPRTATWVNLSEKESSKDLFFINTHFDYEPAAINPAAQLLKNWIIRHTNGNPIVLTGDFNANRDSTAHRLLTMEDSLLQDSLLATHPSNIDDGTFHAYGTINTSIDWILVSNHFEILSSEIDRYRRYNLYPSDHYPVSATVNWK